MRFIAFAILLFQGFLFTSVLAGTKEPIVIPRPQKMEVRSGHFYAGEKLPIWIDPAFSDGALILQSFSLLTTLDAKTQQNEVKKGIVCIYNNAINNAEGYTLRINKNGIFIDASSSAGVFYATQTLKQLRTNSYWKNGKWLTKPTAANYSKLGKLPFVEIEDYPVYSWRGMHLDVSRHFFDVTEIKEYLDLMALHKMNVFHWHLVDDQGWRIEIKKYPQLTSVGAWRKGSMVGKYKDHRVDSIRYGGYYTQEQVKEIVEYASRLHITVVPEIEMPAHSMAALASYPQFSCTGGPFDVAMEWGGFDDVFCAGNDSTFSFLNDILQEIMTLFPSSYIHIGGDECPKKRWKSCPKCQARIKNENLKDENELQSYFIRRIEQFLNSNGRQIIGWDEILEGGLAPNAAVMSWRGREGGIAAANMKHYVVMSPGKPCYFDHYQHKSSKEPLAIGGYNPVDTVYGFVPIAGMDSLAASYVLGAQGNVWTEYMPNWKHVEYMVFPRECALADALWNGGARENYKAFRKPLKKHIKRLKKAGVNCAKIK